jgi:hypothetical protein
MLITFTTINDVAAYFDEYVTEYGLTIDQIRSIFHASDIEYGTPMEQDDPRLAELGDAILEAAIEE